MSDLLSRVRAQCDRAQRPAGFFLVADVRWLLDEVEQREADLLTIIAKIEALGEALDA